MKFTKDDNMKCLVVEYANGSFYRFNLVDEIERHNATNIVTDVDNDFTIIEWRMSKKKTSWAISYQEWQSYIMSGQIYHDRDSEASAFGKKGNKSDEKSPVSTSEDSDDSIESSEGNDDNDSVAIDAPNNKNTRASNICDWEKVIQCNRTALPPLKCQKDGCDILVHHLCQGNWE
jgi:hypothetical protein